MCRLRSLPLLTAVCALACGDSPSESPSVGPIFLSTPVTSVFHNAAYRYQIQATDPSGGSVTIEVELQPDWMEFDANALVLSGTAGWDNVGSNSVRIRAFTSTENTRQTFQVQVAKGEIICASDFGDAATSKYVLPFLVGETQILEQSYCPPNPAWGHHNWFAYDFDTASGDTIVASRAGTVLFTQADKLNGTRDCTTNSANYVFIRHDDGTVMQYVHLTTNGVLVAVGQMVEQGEHIALSGDSGCSSGPHVHVNLFRDNTDFGRRATLPYNYVNADGPLDANGGLIHLEAYAAVAPGG